MGTQDGPAGSVRSRPFSHDVFLLVVVDRRNETRLRLLRWSIERPKTEAVRLGTTGRITGPSNRGFAASLAEDLKKLEKRIAEIEAEIEKAEGNGQKS